MSSNNNNKSAITSLGRDTRYDILRQKFDALRDASETLPNKNSQDWEFFVKEIDIRYYLFAVEILNDLIGGPNTNARLKLMVESGQEKSFFKAFAGFLSRIIRSFEELKSQEGPKSIRVFGADGQEKATYPMKETVPDLNGVLRAYQTQFDEDPLTGIANTIIGQPSTTGPSATAGAELDFHDDPNEPDDPKKFLGLSNYRRHSASEIEPKSEPQDQDQDEDEEPTSNLKPRPRRRSK